jgi:flagellar hook-basal body complex protein FliE
MTAPISGFGGGIGGGTGPQRLGLDIGGENGLARLQPQSSASGPSFSDSLKRALGEVSNAQDVSEDYIGRFVRGEPVELHQVMAAAEEAEISLEMLVQLRGKLTDAYKTVMNMG